MGKRIVDVDVRVHAMIWQKHLEDQPSEARYKQWVEETAAKFGVQPLQVRRVVTQESESLQYQLNQATATETQRLARRYGLTKEKAFRTMEAGLHATKAETLRAEKGGTLMNEVTNRPRVFTQPDYNARAKFLDIFTDWMGMKAPDQSEMTVRQQVNIVNVSPDEIRRRVTELLRKAGELESSGDPRVINVGRGVDGAALPTEPALLAPERNENQG